MTDLDPLLQSAASAPLPQRLELLADAVRRFPRDAAALHALAQALLDAGRFEDAAQAGHRAVQIRPDAAPSYALLATILTAQQKFDRAASLWETALRLDARNPDFWAGFADTLGRAGKLDAAEKALSRELSIRPNHGRALVDMGRTFELRGRLADAEHWFTQAVQRAPDYADAWHRLGTTFGKQGQLDEAVKALARGTQLAPGTPGIWHDLAVAHERLGAMAACEEAYRKALALRPQNVAEWTALGRCLRMQGRLDEARQTLDRALEIDPKNAPAKGERAIITLLGGDFARGWEEYECRFDAPDFPGGRRSFKLPRWNGQPLHGKTIVVWAEQGLGDTLQFLRFVPMVAAMGGKVVLETLAGTERLARTVAGVDRIILKGQAWPPADAQIALMSLPSVFKTVEQTIPRNIPYLRLEDPVRQTWANRIGPPTGKRRIGLTWAGSIHHANDKLRSIALETLRPWFALPGIEWFSLQKGVAENQVAATGLPLRTDISGAVDFMDTAALIEHMDLIISVDTSVVHLAGALGKPVWVLLASVPDWRWMMEREDTPWYPGARLFRQGVGAGWGAVVDRIRTELFATIKIP